MAGVFVSYAREDASKARAIARALEHSSLDVWFDERIQSGAEFSREIEQALKDAAAVVVLWSRNSVESAWVRDEAAEGRDTNRLVPVVLDDVRPPMGFRQFQTTDLSRWSGRGKPVQIDELIAAVSAKKNCTRRAATGPLRTGAHWWQGRLPLVAGALVFLLVSLSAAWIFRPTSRPAVVPTVAVLPFTADASDPDARKLAAATRDALAQTLSAGAFPVSTADMMPQGGRAHADYVISGQVTGAGDKFVATVRMQETAQNFVVFSRQFEASRAQAWDLPERVGAQIASQLSWTAPLIAMDKRHPSDPAVFKALLQSSAAGDAGDALNDYQTASRIAVLAPNSPLALSQLAFNTAFALSEIPRDGRAQAVAIARRATDRTVELAPEYTSGGIPWCLLHSEVRKIECEERLRASMRANTDDPFSNFFLASLVLNPVGRNREAADLSKLSLAHDQYMPFKIGLRLRTLEATDRVTEAADLYRQARRWWPENPVLIWFRETGMVQRGDFAAVEKFAAELGGPDQAFPALVAINRKSLPAMRAACSNAKDLEGIMCMLALARDGDANAAFALADRLYPSRSGRGPKDEEQIWLDNPEAMPVTFLAGAGAAPLRKDPRYLPLAQRVGLLAYWRSGRPPDFCHQALPEPMCSQLRAR